MRSRKFHVLLVLAALMAATAACNALAPKPTVANVRMATDESGNTTTSSYAPGDDFHVFADLGGIKAGSLIDATWYAVNVVGVNPNFVLNTSSFTYLPGTGYVSFRLTNKDGSDWPSGSYRVELYLGGT